MTRLGEEGCRKKDDLSRVALEEVDLFWIYYFVDFFFLNTLLMIKLESFGIREGLPWRPSS